MFAIFFLYVKLKAMKEMTQTALRKKMQLKVMAPVMLYDESAIVENEEADMTMLIFCSLSVCFCCCYFVCLFSLGGRCFVLYLNFTT